jgi:hypothetical protein
MILQMTIRMTARRRERKKMACSTSGDIRGPNPKIMEMQKSME